MALALTHYNRSDYYLSAHKIPNPTRNALTEFIRGNEEKKKRKK